MKVGCKVALVHNNRILLIKEAPYEGGQFPGYWDLPGGTMIEGESINACLLREVKEEVGIDLSDISPGHGMTTGGVRDIQECLAFASSGSVRLFSKIVISDCDFQESSVKLSSDHSEFRWVNPVNSLWFGSPKLMPGLLDVLRKMFPSY